MATLLHISDLHFGADHFYKPGDGVTLRDALVKDLRDKVACQPDCVIISGDLTTHGNKKGLDEATAFVKGLAFDLKLDFDDFVIVPGNHEVDWEKVEGLKKRTKKTPKDFANRLSEVGLTNYKNRVFRKIYGGHVPDKFLTTKWSKDGVFVLGLNSCQFEGPDYPGVGFVAPEQLDWAKSEFHKEWKDCTTRIAVLHHHLVPVTHSSFRPDPSKKSVSVTLNAPDILKWLADNGFQIALHGHQHQPFSATEVRHSDDDRSFSVVVLGVGSAGANRLGWIQRNHYQLIDVSNVRATVHSRTRHSNAPGSFEHYKKLELPLQSNSPALDLRVQEIGLHDFFWFDEVPWSRYFKGANQVEIFALRAAFLFDSQIETVRQFLRREGTTLTLIVHDPADEKAMEWFDQQFGEVRGTRKRKIEEVLNEVKKLRKEAETRGKIDVRFIRGPHKLKYTYYRFDDTILFVPYRVLVTRGPNAIPTFVFGKGSLAEKYLRPDSSFLLKDSKKGAS
jgi:predicted phosphodiesterase